MTTPSDIITQALKESGVLGVGQPASAEDMNDAFFRLNMMMAQWSKKRLLVYHLIDTAFVSTGAQSYTVGTGGNFNIARPDAVLSAFFRQTSGVNTPVDYPLAVTMAREDYNLIALKSLAAWPSIAFYDAAYPLGSLFVWPIPQSGLELHITTKAVLAQFTSLAQVIVLPPEYIGALFYNLAARLRSAYQLPPDPSVTAFAKDSLAVLRQANGAIPEMLFPADLVRTGSGYNIYSDNYG